MAVACHKGSKFWRDEEQTGREQASEWHVVEDECSFVWRQKPLTLYL